MTKCQQSTIYPVRERAKRFILSANVEKKVAPIDDTGPTAQLSIFRAMSRASAGEIKASDLKG